MKRELITVIPPGELREILRKSGAGVSISVEETEPFHGMPRYRLIIEGTREEIERFMETLRLARAGG